MPYLIIQIYDAIKFGYLEEPFTVQDVRKWVKDYKIVKPDKKPYKPSSISAILSNSDIKNSPTSNRNVKRLKSRLNTKKKLREYWRVS